MRVVRSRAQTWMFIAVIALAYAAAAITLGMLRQHAWSEIGTSVLWGIASSVISALVAMGSLPLFGFEPPEDWYGTETPITGTDLQKASAAALAHPCRRPAKLRFRETGGANSRPGCRAA